MILKTNSKKEALKVIVKGNESGEHKMLPAQYKDKFFCTIYYTPIEGGFTAAGGYDVTPETRPGLQKKHIPSIFCVP